MDFISSLIPPLRNSLFAGDYRGACAAWQGALDALPLPRHQRDIPYPDVGGDGLITQTALVGNPAASTVIVLIGGTHGVEGFAGSAIQCDLMALLAAGYFPLADNEALLLVNALNPWGYAFLHRHDHRGVDANRNAVDFSRPLPANPGYEKIRHLFAIPDPSRRKKALDAAAGQLGRRDYEVAVSGGQYTDPSGPFYGGDGPGHCRLVTEQLIADFRLADRRLAVIDIHTGLGPFGYGEVISDHPLHSDGWHTARRWYGAACTSSADGSSSSVPKQGLLDYAWHRIMGADSCFVTLEFGTYDTAALFDVLLADHWQATTLAGYGSEQLREHFCPADNSWREAVIFRGRQVFLQALTGVRQ